MAGCLHRSTVPYEPAVRKCCGLQRSPRVFGIGAFSYFTAYSAMVVGLAACSMRLDDLPEVGFAVATAVLDLMTHVGLSRSALLTIDEPSAVKTVTGSMDSGRRILSPVT